MIACSPHAWGWTALPAHSHDAGRVFPTRVGMDRVRGRATAAARGVPHTRGDGPVGGSELWQVVLCSPHAWGWTAWLVSQGSSGWVFPTRVGMDRDGRMAQTKVHRVPHTRGDGPPRVNEQLWEVKGSPHAWGGTVESRWAGWWGGVFPTRVGMDQERARNDRDGGECSPHAWGWTVGEGLAPALTKVFPTRVGMDRWGQVPATGRRGVPHTRGDGPSQSALGVWPLACSPHAWGWTVGLVKRITNE